MKNITLIAALAVIVGAVTVWSAPPAGADPVVAQAMPAASPSPSPSPPPHAFQISGFADAGYTSASIGSGVNPPPGVPSNQILAGPALAFPYVFDNLNQQIQFHAFNITAAYNGPIGAKVELNLGDDANVINSYPKSAFAPGTDVDLTQVYVSFTSGQFTGIVGKFETLAGAEVIESPSDLNFSRSILFGYAVPFTHTGGRLTWAMNSNLSFIVGLNHGWDTVGPYPNATNPLPDTGSLTIEGGAAWNPSKALSITVQGYTGQVEEGITGVAYNIALPAAVPGGNPFVLNPARPIKSLVDTVITYHMNPSLTFTLNADAGLQNNSNIYNNFGAVVGYGTGTWSGVAGYVNYAINSIWSATVRAEYMGDFGGLRTGINQRWGETTVTMQYAPNSNIIVRGEVRGDLSNQLFFLGNNGNFYHSNSQFGVETIVKWP